MRSTIDEYVQASASIEQAAALRDFADKPLIVLTAGKGTRRRWTAKQNQLAVVRPTACTASSTAPPTIDWS